MLQAKFTVTESQVRFLEEHQLHGFRDRSAMVRRALELLEAEIRRRELAASADLYATLYEADEETREWVEDAARDWPA